MRKVWSDDANEIIAEITSLIDQKATLTLCVKGEKNRWVRPKSIEKQQVPPSIILQKSDDLEILKTSCLFFYRPTSYLTRGFQTRPFKESGKLFAMPLPKEIFEISLRRFPRVSTPEGSKVQFSQEGKARIFKCSLMDLSLEGALLTGEIGTTIRPGDKIGPITMHLCLSFSTEVTVVNVPEATVMNVVESEESAEKTIGIHFHKTDPCLHELEPYIDIRSLELQVKGEQ